MRDFFDIRALAEHESFAGSELARAISTTFERRKSAIPPMPLALTPEFADLDGKRDQWNGFLRKNGLPITELEDVIREVGELLLPLIGKLSVGMPFDKRWPPGGPWR